MNNINQYIFDLVHVLAHLRDTMEFALPIEHDVNLYERRKAVLTKAIDPETPLGKFFKNNAEQFKEVVAKYNEFLDTVYGEGSKVLMVSKDGKLRVDHSQNIVLFKYVTELVEPIKDIVYFHINIANKNKENEAIVEDVIKLDDNYYRVFAYLLLIQEFQKSFHSFQATMQENKGEPSPQSNYIVANELTVMAKIFRDLRSHTRFIDNKTLDLLDDTIKLVEMTEGRRERREGKPFPELFKEVIVRLNDEFTKVLVPAWREKFDKALNAMLEQIKINSEGNKPAENK